MREVETYSFTDHSLTESTFVGGRTDRDPSKLDVPAYPHTSQIGGEVSTVSPYYRGARPLRLIFRSTSIHRHNPAPTKGVSEV